MTCIMQVRVDDQVGALEASLVPTICSLAQIGTWTGFFFPAAAKSTLPFKTPGYCQAQQSQNPFPFDEAKSLCGVYLRR